MEPSTFLEKCRTLLESEWDSLIAQAQQGPLKHFISDQHRIDAIRRSINSTTKTYRYVLPTQLLAKLADPALDCTCLQVVRGGEGAFDARTVAHKIIVPFDQANDRALGGSPEPYVNNPLRVPEISPAYRGAQKNAAGWDDLCLVLGEVQRQSKPAATLAVFRQALKEVVARLQTVRVTFPIPGRVSLKDSLRLVEHFVTERSGGDRFEAITAALFDALGRHFHAWSKIRRAKVTAADAASGMTGDIECLDDDGDVVLAVEAKDRQLTITQLKDKLPGLRENRVSEAFFIAGRGIRPEDADEVQELIDREFVSGQNIYVSELLPLCQVLLALLGDTGRRTFLECVCAQLQEHSDIHHRRAWAQLLATV